MSVIVPYPSKMIWNMLFILGEEGKKTKERQEKERRCMIYIAGSLYHSTTDIWGPGNSLLYIVGC
jgi:hypothetical protein